MDAKRRKTGDQDISDLRLASRQKYLAEREAQQLALLRRQVAEEAEEEDRLGLKLSERERKDFARNRETLRLAEARNAIDEHRDGYILPDADYSNKNEILTRRHKEKDYEKSEVQLWEEEQTKKVASQAKRPERTREEDYEYVFDESVHISFKALAQANIDPEKQRLQAALDEVEMKARTIDEVRKSLPIYKYKSELIQAIKDHPVIVVQADTGSGKSTQLTSYCMEAGFGENDMRIACTQPRRVAAMSVAQRVADENHSRLGKTVGYSVRFESKQDETTVIEYMTDGILCRMLLESPLLDRYSVVVLDEAHERSIGTDMLIVLTRQISRARPDFRLIISSASLNAQRFSEYFDDAPVFAVPGRTFPITKHFTSSPEANYLNAAVTTVFQIHIGMAGEQGDILVFLAGQDEIDAAAQYCEDTMKKLGNKASPLIIAPIYGALPAESQQLIFSPTPKGSRKVVLATNIAETSLTIDGVRFVVDSGVEKQMSFDPRIGMSSLTIVPCSRASAEQRAGRAGRTGPGKCFRLYTAWSYANELPEAHLPEVQRADFDSVALTLKSMGINDLLHFEFMDPPPINTIAKSLENLYSYGFLNSAGSITKLGRRASELPLDPRLSKTLLSADQYGCASEVITIVAMVAEAGSLFFAPKDKKMAAEHAKARFFQPTEGGDMLGFLRLYLEFEESGFSPLFAKENFVQYRSLNRVRDVREQLLNLCDKVEISRSSCGISDHVSIMKALTAGFFQNAARLQRDGQTYAIVGKGGMAVRIHPSSCMSKTREKWIIFNELVQTSAEFMRSCAPIDPAWLLEVAPHLYKQSDLEKLGIDKKVGKGPGKVGVD